MQIDPGHEEATVNQALLHLITAQGNRFYPLQGCWNYSISKLLRQGRQHGEDNKLTSRKPHPLCHCQQLPHDHFLKDKQRMGF